MAIDAKLVAELRRRTGLPMMKCKEALEETGGAIEKAEENLRKLGHKTAEKVKDRALKEGLVFVHAAPQGVAAAALLCETDFVARSAEFTAFGEDLAQRLYEAAPADRGQGADLASLKTSDGSTAADRVQGLIGKIRENIALGEWARFRTAEGYVAHYAHHTGKVAALVELAGKDIARHEAVKQLGQDLCMHVSFHAEARVLDRSELDQAWLEKEREIFAAQVQDMPENKREAILKGKLEKRIKEVVFPDQPFIKDEKKSVRQRVDEVAKEVGTPIEIRRFARIAAGG